MTRRNDERGFTMIEMLVVMFIASIVLAGVTTLMQTVLRQSTNIVSKTEASQRGRLVMDRMTRELRSQVCLDLGYDTARPGLEAADRNSITFFTDLSDGEKGKSKPPVKLQLSYDSANRRIVEREYPLTSAVDAHPTTYSTIPSATRTLLDNVVANADTGNFFSYRKYTGGPVADATDTVVVSGNTPISATDLAAIARITISMDVRPTRSKTAQPFTRLEDSVLVRNLNKNPDYSPTNAKALLCE